MTVKRSDPERKPAFEQFLLGLWAIKDSLTALQRRLLIEQYGLPSHRCFAKQLAERVSAKDWRVVNRHYAFAAKKFCEAVAFSPPVNARGKPQWWGVWSVGFDHGDGRFEWKMHDELVRALEHLGWVEAATDDRSFFADEVCTGSTTYPEGTIRQIHVNAYERSADARSTCLNHHGFQCAVCAFDFGVAYGDIGHGFMHVHHLQPISKIGASYLIDPIRDLRPVCPNCHAMLHRRDPPLSVEELRAAFRWRAILIHWSEMQGLS